MAVNLAKTGKCDTKATFFLRGVGGGGILAFVDLKGIFLRVLFLSHVFISVDRIA